MVRASTLLAVEYDIDLARSASTPAARMDDPGHLAALGLHEFSESGIPLRLTQLTADDSHAYNRDADDAE